MKIKEAIRNRFTDFDLKIAEAIKTGDWKFIIHNIGICCLILSVFFTIALLIFIICSRLFGEYVKHILGFFVGIPLMIYILFLSYQANYNDSRKSHENQKRNNQLEIWAENIYEYVRDAMYLVFRSMSDYTAIIMPSSPSSIELPNGISIKNNYVVFNFIVRVRDIVDPTQIKRELNRTLSQMLRAHELNGVPSELVLINGSYYTPLQIYDIVDWGDSISVSVVFADENTVDIIKARKIPHFEISSKRSHNKPDPLYDDEL